MINIKYGLSKTKVLLMTSSPFVDAEYYIYLKNDFLIRSFLNYSYKYVTYL